MSILNPLSWFRLFRIISHLCYTTLWSQVNLDLNQEITTLKLSSNGSLLAVGTRKGNVLILDSRSFASKSKEPFSLSKAAIKELVFCPDDVYLGKASIEKCCIAFFVLVKFFMWFAFFFKKIIFTVMPTPSEQWPWSMCFCVYLQWGGLECAWKIQEIGFL